MAPSPFGKHPPVKALPTLVSECYQTKSQQTHWLFDLPTSDHHLDDNRYLRLETLLSGLLQALRRAHKIALPTAHLRQSLILCLELNRPATEAQMPHVELLILHMTLQLSLSH